MYTVTTAARIRIGSFASEAWNAARSSLEARPDADRQAHSVFGLLDRAHGLSERGARRQVEGERHYRELPLVIDRERRRLLVSMRVKALSGTCGPVEDCT